jgi:hypothetical protein
MKIRSEWMCHIFTRSLWSMCEQIALTLALANEGVIDGLQQEVQILQA